MKKILSFRSKILLAILSLFGVSACESGMTVEYGCPITTFKVHGTVSDEQHNPIQGIAVHRGWDNDTTGPDGKYQLYFDGVMVPDAPDTLEVTDTDTLRETAYCDTVIPISFNGIQPVGGDGHWDQGTYILQRDIQLRQK